VIKTEMKKYIVLMWVMGSMSLSASAQVLSLDACKIFAIENNRQLKEARMQLEASGQVRKNAFTNYFPRVDAGALAFKSNKALLEAEIPEMNLPVYDGNPVNIPNATQFTYFPGMHIEMLDYTNAGFLSAIQPLYMGGKIRNGNKLAALGEEVSGYNLEMTSEEVVVKTESLFWTLTALKEKRKTLLSYEQLLNNLLKDVTVSYDAGLINKSDLLKIKIELSKVEASKLKLDNGLTMLKMSLAQHIGVAYSENFDIEKTPLEVVTPDDLYRNPQEALIDRNEYKMLSKAIDAEVLQKNMVRAEHLPSVAVGVQGLYLDVMEDQNTYGMAFATVSVPISGWWGGTHKMKEHKIKVEMAESNLAEKSELLLLQIEKAYMDMNESYSQILVAESTEEQAEEHLKVTRDNFDAGVIGTSDLLEAQAMRQDAQDAVVDVKTVYMIKQMNYLQAIAQLQK
jgi:outer membrane protein TolC